MTIGSGEDLEPVFLDSAQYPDGVFYEVPTSWRRRKSDAKVIGDRAVVRLRDPLGYPRVRDYIEQRHRVTAIEYHPTCSRLGSLAKAIIRACQNYPKLRL